MTEEQNREQPLDQDAVIVYFNPELMQGRADVAAKKKASFQELLSAAEEGDLDAEYRLALSYCNGENGAPKDEQQAFVWFARAAEGDHLAAQYDLGLCYFRGIGTAEDMD